LLFQTSLGIDVQDHAVSMAYLKGSFSGNGARITAHAVYPLKPIQSIEEKMEQIGGLVRDFLIHNSISSTSVFLCVPRAMAILRYLELPSAVRENLKESIGYQMESYVPFSAAEVYYDCQATGKGTEKMRVLLAAAKKGEIDPYLSLGTRLNVRFSGIEVRSTAVANYFLSQPDFREEKDLSFIYSGDGFLEVGVLKSGFLAYSRRYNREGPESRLAERVGKELFKTIQESGGGEGRLETILFGQESDAPFMDALSGVEGLEVHRADLSKRGLPSPALIAAYGAALKGIMKLPMEINLMPDVLRKRPSKAGRYMLFGLTGVLILSALAWGSGNVFHQRLYVKRLNGEIQRLRVAVSEIEKIETQVKGIEGRILSLNSFYGDDLSVLEVLRELTVKIPKSAWIQSLTFSEGEVRIDGSADSSSELVSLLDASGMFEDVAFMSPISREAGGKERFRIKFRAK